MQFFFTFKISAFKADMRKIILTVHDNNAEKFFKNNLKYEIDETCPTFGDGVNESDYKILSKFNKRKIAKEASEQPRSGCCSKC